MKVLLEELIALFSQFPGVGRRTAERFAFYILSLPKTKALEIADAIVKIKDKIKNCPLCNNLSEEGLCSICSDDKRDPSLLCIVEEPRDIIALEKTNAFSGKYYVLLGVINPLEGIGPEDIKIDGLISRINSSPEIQEVILATDADAEGEATAAYITKKLKSLSRNIKITRIGFGLPAGADLEFADRNTLIHALHSRREFAG